MIGIDLADQMLALAGERAHQLDASVELWEGDVAQLEFSDNAFDTAVATFVFCSVTDPVRRVREFSWVVNAGVRIVLLDHVRIDRPMIGHIMD